MTEFFDTGLLLGQQPLAQDRRRCGWHAAVEWAFPAQMGDVGGADHDLGRHTTDVDAGATDGAALNQRDLRALLDGLQCCRHRGSTAADHGDLQRALAAAALVGGTHPAAHLVEQPSAVVGRRGIGEHRFVAQASHGGGQCVRRCAWIKGELGRALGIGHYGRLDAGYFFQRFLDVRRARVAGHAGDF